MIILITAAILYFLVLPLIGYRCIIAFLLGFFYSRTYFDGSENSRGRRWWPWFQDRLALLLQIFGRRVFQYTIIYHGSDKENPPDKIERIVNDGNGIYCAYPHGLFVLSSVLHLSTLINCFKHLKVGVHRHIFSIPLLREIILWSGGISPTKETISELLDNESLYIVISGSRGMIDEEKQHRGILDIAWERKKYIIPCVHKGQENVFHCYRNDIIDRMRLVSMDWTGYAFPTIFTMWPAPLTTHIYEPIHPHNYRSADDFCKAYYAIVTESK